ncbi:MAG: 4Fe-4S binding protein [Armatimonadota bacterium]
MEQELRAKAKELLESGKADVVIGYGAGSVPARTTPVFVRKPEDAEKLVWNKACVNNLAVYLPNVKGKVAVVLKPCDAKSVVELAKEHQIDRSEVCAIVVSCPGVIGDVKDATADPDALPLAGKCQACTIGEAPTADITVGEPVKREPASDASVAEYEAMSAEERRAFWAKHFSRCIRCYACRQACPGCYCRECFVDKNGAIWASKATDPEANWFFHMTRAMHIAGRCVGCGECERACPMGIPLSLMGKRLNADVAEMFECDPGADPEAQPALACYTMHDPDPCRRSRQ